MKIRDLLEEVNKPGVNIAIVAKEFLDVGERKAREALRKAGYEPINGKKGYHFVGTGVEPLDASIYEYVTSIPEKKLKKIIEREPALAESVSAASHLLATSNKEEDEFFEQLLMDVGEEPISDDEKERRKRAEEIMDSLFSGEEEDETCYRGYYFDPDILWIIEQVKVRKRSIFINQCLRKLFKEKGYLKKYYIHLREEREKERQHRIKQKVKNNNSEEVGL